MAMFDLFLGVVAAVFLLTILGLFILFVVSLCLVIRMLFVMFRQLSNLEGGRDVN